MVKTTHILLLALLCISLNAVAKVTATIDKNPVIAGESFVLEVVADEDLNNNAFDSQALLKDFIVGRTSVSSQTSMVNFKTSYSTRWKTLLIARKAGNYTIPVFDLDGKQTTPIQLRVLAENSTGTTRPKDLFIESSISAKEVYVQQQVTLQVKLYFASELKRGSLTEPSLEGATITQIGKDKEDVEVINGRRFRVIERNYAINPQKSGDFMLSSPMFSGEIIKTSSRRSSFLSFGESTPVSVLGKEIALKVRPIPASYQGQWLPSELLSIYDEWQPKNKQFKVGEPITRTITLTAAGLSEEQLPKLDISVPKGLKVYPDQAELHTSVNDSKLISQKVKNFALVASAPGTYTLPKMVIPWWNTITNRYQEAVLAEQTITVAANDEFATSPLPTSSELSTTNQPFANQSAADPEGAQQSPFLQWLFLALWLLTSAAWLATSLYRKRSKIPTERRAKINHDYLVLLKHCKKNQGEQVLASIIPWLNSIALSHKTLTTLDEAVQAVNQASFSKAINQLQQCYYSKSDQTWHGGELLASIEKINRRQQQKGQTKHQEQQLNLNP
jgi:oxygen tolerance protein BatD